MTENEQIISLLAEIRDALKQRIQTNAIRVNTPAPRTYHEAVQAPRKAVQAQNGESKGQVYYKGQAYDLVFKGKTKFGDRAKLRMRNGKEFWVPLNLIEEPGGYEPDPEVPDDEEVPF